MTPSQAPTRRQCTAKSKKTGLRCTRPPRLGARVCHQHGGAAPQVLASARQRLDNLVDPAIARLAQLVKHKHPFVALGAVKDVLDRAGYKPVLAVQSDNKLTVVVEYAEPLPAAAIPKENVHDGGPEHVGRNGTAGPRALGPGGLA